MFAPVTSRLVNAIRTTGHMLDMVGKNLEVNPFVEKLQPSLKNVTFASTAPVVKASFVAPCATVIGKVNIGQASSVWYGAVIRGDVNTIKIGDNVCVGDRVMVHCSRVAENATKIGNNVHIRPGAIIHGCTLEDGVVIGDGAQIMDGGKVGKNSVILPGTVVPPGKVIPANEVWGGCPAKMVSVLSEADVQESVESLSAISDMAVVHATESGKSWQAILLDEEEKYQIENRQPYYYRRRNRAEWSKQFDNPKEAAYPGRIFNSPLSAHKHHPAFRPE